MLSVLVAVPWADRPGRKALLVVLTGLMGCPALMPSTTAAAFERMAELPTGGLMLPRSAAIEITSQDLYISPRQIRASYRFRNASPEDARSRVVFPMPDITVSDTAAGVTLPSDDPRNLLGFAARVDGKPVKPNVVQKVFARGMDRTADLERLNVPLAPHLRATGRALQRLPPEGAEELTRKGLAAAGEHGAGRGMPRQLAPRWTLRTTFYWDQVFPARTEVAIEHHYRPSIGKSAQTLLGDPEAMKEPWFKEYRRKYCLDDSFLATVERARQAAKRQGGAPFAEERIFYLLATGARPVGELHLVVDAGSRSSLVSFCGKGVRKTGSARYEMRKAAFAPGRNLHILILKPTRGR